MTSEETPKTSEIVVETNVKQRVLSIGSRFYEFVGAFRFWFPVVSWCLCRFFLEVLLTVLLHYAVMVELRNGVRGAGRTSWSQLAERNARTKVIAVEHVF